MSQMCPCCGNRTWKPCGQAKDHSITQETFNLEQCTTCGVIQTLLAPSIRLEKYYQSEAYISHTSTAKNLMQEIYLLARRYTLNRKRKFLARLAKGDKRILDYGCGTGELIAYLQTSGWSTEGLEPDKNARTKALGKGPAVYETLSDIPSTKQYKLISLWHVLEHVPDPYDILQHLKSHLAPDGRIIIAVPNPNSHDAQTYQDYWAGLDVPRHVWHFPKKAIHRLAEKIQMNVEQILPMKLDSFYVSLLSEEYKGTSGIKRWINAFRNGLSSNLHAKQSGEWSSLIYVLQA